MRVWSERCPNRDDRREGLRRPPQAPPDVERGAPSRSPVHHALCKFLFSYAYGTPTKHVIDKVQKPPVVFATVHGYLPWDSRVDPGHQRSLDLIARKEAEEKLRALEAGKPEVVIDRPGARG